MKYSMYMGCLICAFLDSELSGSPTGESDQSSGLPIPVVSNFEEGVNDGWTLTDSNTPLVSTDGSCGLVQVDTNPGFLCADANEEGGTSYFVAPEKFNGDLNVYSTLKFRIVANGGTYFDSGFGFDGDIVLSNGVSQASYTFTEDQRPTDVFRNYEISLTDSELWQISDGSPLSTVLQSTTALRIRAEYGAGADNSGLDDVSLE